jgi:hypothetical protein
MAPQGPQTPSLQMSEWNMPMQHEYPIQEYHQDPMSHQRQLPQLQRLHTLSIGRSESLGAPSPIDSLGAYAESDYNSPISHSFQNDDVPFLHSPMYNGFSSRNSTTDQSPVVIMGDSRGPTSCPDNFYPHSDMSSSISSHQGLYDIAEGRQHQPSPAANDVFYDDEMLGMFIVICICFC